MKKITLLLAILGTFAFADSGIYVGAGATYNDVTTTYSALTQDENFNEESLKLKIGYGDRTAYAIEFATEYVNSDPKKYAFDISLLKAFDLDIYVNPFAKVGFGAGIVDNRDNANKSLTFGSFNFGGGLFIPLNETFDAELGYEYKNRSYQREDETNAAESQTSSIHSLYFGVNARF